MKQILSAASAAVKAIKTKSPMDVAKAINKGSALLSKTRSEEREPQRKAKKKRTVKQKKAPTEPRIIFG